MRNIQPLEIWSNGDTTTATMLGLYISYDDLSTQAALVYKLYDEIGSVIYEGQITFTDQEYLNWGSSANSNNEAYTLAAAKLNLILA